LSTAAKHVVVTGAGGFVGGFVARWLAARGWNVTAILRRPAELGVPALPRLTWRTADLGSPGSLPKAFDAIVHCAVDVPKGAIRSESVYHLNMGMARAVFEQALAAEAHEVVFLSSMSAYGAISAPLVTEDLPPGELDPYGRAKRDSEGLLQSCIERGLLSALSLRLPGTVGKGSHGNFLSIALNRVLSGAAVHAKNPDSMFNNIVYVGDLAAFLSFSIASPRPGYGVTNLGAVEPLPMREVLSLLFEFSGREERVVFEPGGKKPFLISLDRAVSLGYCPSTVRASIESFVRDSV
jgi:NDP-hexose 4-ketoreductase